MNMLLAVAEDRATLRSDPSADCGDFIAESDAAHVALFCLYHTTLCGKSQCVKPQVRAEPDEPKASYCTVPAIALFNFAGQGVQIARSNCSVQRGIFIN